MPKVYDRVRPEQPGMVTRNAAWWEHVFADLEPWRDGASPLFFAVYESAAGVDGYVAYRVKAEWSEGTPNNIVKVREAHAVDPTSFAAVCDRRRPDGQGGSCRWPPPAVYRSLNVTRHAQVSLRCGDAGTSTDVLLIRTVSPTPAGCRR